MSLVTKVTPSIDASTAQFAPQYSGLVAGEALAICAPCYIASDGLVYESISSGSAAAGNEVTGFTARAVAISEPVTLFGVGTRMRYAAGLTPGASLFLGATKGRLDTATTVGDSIGIAVCVNTTDIMVVRCPSPGETAWVYSLA